MLNSASLPRLGFLDYVCRNGGHLAEAARVHEQGDSLSRTTCRNAVQGKLPPSVSVALTSLKLVEYACNSLCSPPIVQPVPLFFSLPGWLSLGRWAGNELLQIARKFRYGVKTTATPAGIVQDAAFGSLIELGSQ